jgi:hypothetical protein
MSKPGTAERRNIYQPDRGRTGVRDSGLPTFAQTHFRIGKDLFLIVRLLALIVAIKFAPHDRDQSIPLPMIFSSVVIAIARRGLYQTVRFTIVTHDSHWRRINNCTSVKDLDTPEMGMFLNARTGS